MMMDFAGRLKRLHIEKGYSQATLAKKITDAGQKLGEASIAKYENGRIYPNLHTSSCMADCFGVSIDYLACGEKAAVVSVDGLTDEQINLMTELTRALRQQNKSRWGNPKSTPTPEQQELAQGMVRVNHLYRSALKVAVTQLEILDEEFASLYDHSPIHHIEYRIKTVDSIVEKLKRRGFEVTIDNIYAHIQDVAGVRVICNYLDDICYLRSLLARNENFKIIREVNYIKEPKESGYRSLHLICDVPIVISEGTLHLPVEIQLRTIAMDMWASLEHELRYKSQRDFSPSDAARLRLCSDAISEIDREMQDIYQGRGPEYHA